MRARAVIVAERCGPGTRLTTLRSDPPVTLRPTGAGVYLAASAAGPIGGDTVHLDVTVGPGADLEVRSVAAALALPGPSAGCSASTTSTSASVASGGEMRWLVEPTVLVRGCDHRVDTRVELAAGAGLVWREEVVLGRSGEAPGSVLQRLRIDRGGRPLRRTEHAGGPRWPGSTGPAGMGGYRALGTLTVVGAATRGLVVPPVGEQSLLAASEVADDAVVICAVARTARMLRETLDLVLGSRTVGVALAGQAVEHAVGHLGHDTELLGGHLLDEPSPHRDHVAGSR